MISILIAILLLLTAGSAAARPMYAPLGTAFTYQGRLTDGGNPANGTYDFIFKLYDDEVAGFQAGSTLEIGSVQVTEGLFTVQLDIGDVFEGTALWLEIGVAAGGTGGPYTTLDPRQPLTPTPYAIYASKAPWDGLIGVPAGFADGVDDGSSYQNVVVVAQSGGDFTSIQSALDSISDAASSNRYLVYVAPGVYTEQVTMESYVDIQGSGELNTRITFTGSASASTGTLIGANDAELRYLTVENTGGDLYATAIYNASASPRLTHVTASASGGTTASYGLHNNASSPTMTNMTVSASGGVSSYGVYSSSSSPTMANVTASASGGTAVNYGVYNGSSSPTMTDITVSASGGNLSYGVFNASSPATMRNVTASASGATSQNYGVLNSARAASMRDMTASGSGGAQAAGVNNFLSSPTMTNVSASASGGATFNLGVWNYSSSPTMTNITSSASGGTECRGVFNNSSSSPTMTNVTASGSGGTNTYGVYNEASSPTISNSTASASGGTNNYGVYNFAFGGSHNVRLNASQIIGATSTIFNDVEFTTNVGASLLSGGGVAAGGGTVTCAGVYDESYTFYASTCP